MKKAISIITFSFLLATKITLAQLNAGDIAFVGYSADGNDGFAFVTFVSIANNTTIYFTDESWDGSSFTSSSEGTITWTNNTGSIISAGTVITISDASSSPSASIGTATESDAGFNLNINDDAILAFVGTDDNTPTTFLAAIATDDFSVASVTLTGLTVDDTAIEMDNKFGATDDDVAVYAGSTTCNSTISDCRQLITNLTTNPSNWLTDEGSGDQSQDGIDAEFPSPNGGGTGITGNFSGTALPVELIFFHAIETQNEVELIWQTASETDNSHFEIEHSTDGYTFDFIGEILGNGTTTLPMTYTFVDYYPNDGMNYYRLKQVDYNGEYEYSDIVAVNLSQQKNKLNIYPNPTHDFLTLELERLSDKNTVVQIFNVNRQLIQMTSINSTTSILDVKDLPKGNYMLRIIDNQQTFTERFIRL